MVLPVKRFLVSMCVLILLLSTVSPIFAQDAVASVSVPSLNVRSGPGLEFGSIFVLPQGFGVRLIARNNEANWVLISLTDGKTGWVNVNYIYTTFRVFDLPISEASVAQPVVPTATIVNYLNLNVHERPDPASPVFTSVPLNAQYPLLGRNFDATWAQIRLPDGRAGWVIVDGVQGTVPIRGLAPTDGSINAPTGPGGGTSGGDQGGGFRVHVVQPGETLSGIAARYGVNVFTLAAQNRIPNINFIYSGQRLVIP